MMELGREMALNDLTSREAVLAALLEFDQLGRDAFLKKYGFSPAHSYLLEYDGKFYDSKAIAGAAHGYQFPERGPLQAREFSGGAAHAAAKLERLGFTIRTVGVAEQRYWSLGANPWLYRIQDAARELLADWWTVGQRDPAPGDCVVIWKFKGGEEQRSVIALGEVLTSPEYRGDADNPYWIQRSDAVASKRRVLVRYIPFPNLPLWLDDHPNLLGGLSIARATGGSVFKLTPEQWTAIVQAAEGTSIEQPTQPDVDAELDGPGETPAGQGFRASAEERQAIEHYSMREAIDYFTSAGWQVEDVSARESFDLRCRRSGKPELHVEVKGTTGDGSKILLTANEVAHARRQYPNIALVVVAGIQIGAAAHGRVRVIQPWKVSERQLAPLTFSYRLDRG